MKEPLVIDGIDRLLIVKRKHKSYPPVVFIGLKKDVTAGNKTEEALMVQEFVNVEFFPAELKKLIRSYIRGEEAKETTKEEGEELMKRLLEERNKHDG